MAIEVTRLNRVIGAIVSGVDLARELPRSVIDRLGELMVEHQVLFFRNQPITPQQQRDFAAHFGTLHIHPIYPVLPDLPEIMLLDPWYLNFVDNMATVQFDHRVPCKKQISLCARIEWRPRRG